MLHGRNYYFDEHGILHEKYGSLFSFAMTDRPVDPMDDIELGQRVLEYVGLIDLHAEKIATTAYENAERGKVGCR